MAVRAESRIYVDVHIARRPEEIRERAIRAAFTLAENWPTHNVFVGITAKSVHRFMAVIVTGDPPRTSCQVSIRLDNAEPPNIELKWERGH